MKKLLFFHEDADEGGCYPVDKFLGAKVSGIKRITMAFKKMDGQKLAENATVTAVEDLDGVAIKRAFQVLANSMGPTGPKAAVKTVIADKISNNYIGDVFNDVNAV
tara:strand:- start:1324 stop:1641 length:318 start_codon:yes stop_codon:yes gene_type:complete